jgi:DedD protein
VIDLRERNDRTGPMIDRPQVVWLTLGGICALGLMFAAGYVVGRRAARIEPVAAAPADPLAQIESDRAMHEKLTFYERLKDPRAPVAASQRAPATPQPPPPPEAAEHHEPAPIAAAPAPVAPPKPPKPAPVAEASKPSPVAEAPKPAPAPMGDELRRAMNSGPANAGEYTVQVSAFQSLPEAQAFASGLERRGYRPFVVTTSINGKGTWYRVRLGRYHDEGEAKAAKTLLAQSDIAAWVLRTE